MSCFLIKVASHKYSDLYVIKDQRDNLIKVASHKYSDLYIKIHDILRQHHTNQVNTYSDLFCGLD